MADSNNITLNDITYLDNGKLGEGGFGSVCLVNVRGKDKKYALKKVSIR